MASPCLRYRARSGGGGGNASDEEEAPLPVMDISGSEEMRLLLLGAGELDRPRVCEEVVGGTTLASSLAHVSK